MMKTILSQIHVCPIHQEPMILCEISYEDRVIGYIWGCSHDTEPDYCDECEDCMDDEIPAEYPKIGEQSRFAEITRKGV